MAFQNLPAELVANIGAFLGEDARVGPYAVLSRRWQNAVEDITFASLKLYSTDLDDFTSAVARSHPHRKAAIRKINFAVVLPAYGTYLMGRSPGRLLHASQSTPDFVRHPLTLIPIAS